MDQGMGGVRRLRRFGEAAQDQFYLARIRGDIADGENTWLVGGAGPRIDGDQTVVQVELPIGDRPKVL